MVPNSSERYGHAAGGQPATLTAGGRGGTASPDAHDGDGPLAFGSNGGYGLAGYAWRGGGGGGGGYYGGGAGGPGDPARFEGAGGGGGGSSWVSSTALHSAFPAATDDTSPQTAARSTENRPTLNGGAGIDTGDDKQVKITLYRGLTPRSRRPYRELTATVEPSGWWSLQLDQLEPGGYAARVTQGDAGHNQGEAEVIFIVDAPAADPEPPSGPKPPADPPSDPQPPADEAPAPNQPKDGGDAQQPSAPQPPQISAAHRTTLGLPTRSQRLRTVLRRGLATTLTCDGTCTAQVRLVLPARYAKRYGLGRKAVVIASARSNHPGRVVLRLSGKTRKALAHARSLRVRVEASATGSAPVFRHRRE